MNVHAMARRHGFTLIELLIVITIIGILAAVLVPRLLAARDTAQYRAALAHTRNVYTASIAHLAEDPANSEVLGDCTSGYAAGTYVVPDPKNGRLMACTVEDPDSDGQPSVRTVLTDGTVISFP